MMTLNRTLELARRTLALSALLGASLAPAHAQQATSTAATATTAEPTLNLQVPSEDRGTAFSSSSASSSSSTDSDGAVVAKVDNPFDSFVSTDKQPPARRGYNRPRYRGGNTNADGSNKYAFLAGAGYTQPIGNTYHYLTPSWGLQVGGGRNFDKNFGLIAQFDYDNFGFNGRTLASQMTIYNSVNVFGPGALAALDGHTHIWSLTLNPTFTIAQGDSGMGAYIVGGVGFYHKRADFTTPTIVQDIFGDEFQANQIVDDYTSNAPGFNGGFGLTYKMSRFSGERLYAEARYVYIANKQRPGFTVNTISQILPTSTNLFPANSNRTTYIPVKVGIRF
jgi:hypothetical protein